MQVDVKTPALLAVIVERERQVMSEGWTPEHDDEHDDGSLAAAAACYATAMPLTRRSEQIDVSGGRGETAVWRSKAFSVPKLWPESWHPAWWKPQERRRNLVRAAALILAEIERLDRAEGRTLDGTSGVSASDSVPVPPSPAPVVQVVEPRAGWKLVPVEPTPKMKLALMDKAHGWPTEFDVSRQWAAALAAVPQEPRDAE